MCDLYSALSLWYSPAYITSEILYHRLFVSEIPFLKNGQKKTSKSFGDLEALFQPFRSAFSSHFAFDSGT